MTNFYVYRCKISAIAKSPFTNVITSFYVYRCKNSAIAKSPFINVITSFYVYRYKISAIAKSLVTNVITIFYVYRYKISAIAKSPVANTPICIDVNFFYICTPIGCIRINSSDCHFNTLIVDFFINFEFIRFSYISAIYSVTDAL